MRPQNQYREAAVELRSSTSLMQQWERQPRGRKRFKLKMLCDQHREKKYNSSHHVRPVVAYCKWCNDNASAHSTWLASVAWEKHMLIMSGTVWDNSKYMLFSEGMAGAFHSWQKRERKFNQEREYTLQFILTQHLFEKLFQQRPTVCHCFTYAQ